MSGKIINFNSQWSYTNNLRERSKFNFKFLFSVFIIAIFLILPLIGISYYAQKMDDLSFKMATVKEEISRYKQESNSLKVEISKVMSPSKVHKIMERYRLRYASAQDIIYLNLDRGSSLDRRLASKTH